MESYEIEEKKTKKREKEQFYKRLGDRIFHYRKPVMNQAELSEVTGLSKATISSIENGSPTEAYNIHLLAQALNKPTSSLMYGELEFQHDYVYGIYKQIQNLPPEYQKIIFSMLENMIRELEKL
ncbi:MAG: helix-turn-helix transcriptional regulator [Firmicutes bacterium]|nr:helix-turn-helix transcriptional regulator [Bacillota bacterium]